MEEQLAAAFETLIEQPDVDFHPALTTLVKLVNNVLQHPEPDSKFRKVAFTSKVFQDKVWKVKGAPQFLQALGWTREGDFFIFPESGSMEALEIGWTLLQTGEDRHAEYQRQQRAKQRKQEHAAEEAKKKEILAKVQADRKEVSQKEYHDSKSQLCGGGANISNFRALGVDLNKGGR
ncbi:UBX domain-containing protein 6 [Balamuthia mandrillaris]